MASQCSVFAIGQRFDKKVTITLQRSETRRSSTTQQEQTRNSESAPNPHNTGHSTFQCNHSVCKHVAGCTANAETSDSGGWRGSYHPHEHLEHVKVLDASRSTFNKIGHNQYNLHNCYVNFVDHHHHNHFYLRETLDNPDPGMNSENVSDNCKPTRIESTTTFRTTNVSVVAPYFADLGVPDSSSEGSEDSVFAVKSARIDVHSTLGRFANSSATLGLFVKGEMGSSRSRPKEPIYHRRCQVRGGNAKQLCNHYPTFEKYIYCYSVKLTHLLRDKFKCYKLTDVNVTEICGILARTMKVSVIDLVSRDAHCSQDVGTVEDDLASRVVGVVLSQR